MVNNPIANLTVGFQWLTNVIKLNIIEAPYSFSENEVREKIFIKGSSFWNNYTHNTTDISVLDVVVKDINGYPFAIKTQKWKGMQIQWMYATVFKNQIIYLTFGSLKEDFDDFKEFYQTIGESIFIYGASK